MEKSSKRSTYFFNKYFLEGQLLEEKQEEALNALPTNASRGQRLLIKHRRIVGILIPLVFVQTIWWMQAVKSDYFSLFPDRYLMSITMIFGATVAGMTSEGGGAVAFPVMTLALNISPAVARDFSLMIQAVGMNAAAFTIFWMKIKLEYHSIIFCTVGSFIGMILGLEVIDGLLTPPQKKLGFVCIWFSFAFALFLLNREHKRTTFNTIPCFGVWQALVLLLVGILGGVFSGLAGSGVDICSFSILTLLFRVSEKIATPTSIVLMGINTTFGFYWREMMMGGVEESAWGYLKVCVPVVVIFAPLGSIIASHFHRQVLAVLVYVLDTIALISAFIVLRDVIDLYLGLMSAGLLILGFAVFYLISLRGRKYVEYVNEQREADDGEDILKA